MKEQIGKKKKKEKGKKTYLHNKLFFASSNCSTMQQILGSLGISLLIETNETNTSAVSALVCEEEEEEEEVEVE